MNALRIAALLTFGWGAALVLPAADRAGPAPSEMIYPRGAEPTGSTPGSADVTAASAEDRGGVFAPGPSPATSGLLPAFGYIIAFGALIGGGWLLLKRGGLRRPFGKSEGKLRVLETKMLGNRQFLMVVEYDDAKLLLGVCPGKIDYLTPLAGHPLATGAHAVMTGQDDDEATAITFPTPEVRR